jgi:hypothetical protein
MPFDPSQRRAVTVIGLNVGALFALSVACQPENNAPAFAGGGNAPPLLKIERTPWYH